MSKKPIEKAAELTSDDKQLPADVVTTNQQEDEENPFDLRVERFVPRLITRAAMNPEIMGDVRLELHEWWKHRTPEQRKTTKEATQKLLHRMAQIADALSSEFVAAAIDD